MNVVSAGLQFHPRSSANVAESVIELMQPGYVFNVGEMNDEGISEVTVTAPVPNPEPFNPTTFSQITAGNFIYLTYGGGADNAICRVMAASSRKCWILTQDTGVAQGAATVLTYASDDRFGKVKTPIFPSQFWYQANATGGKINGVVVNQTYRDPKRVGGLEPKAFDGDFDIEYETI
jgi:hypothetical protein